MTQWTAEPDWIESALDELDRDRPEHTGGGLWTPLEIKDYIANLISRYKSLHKDISKCRDEFSDAELESWKSLMMDFSEWVRDLINWDLLWGGTADTAERYARQLNTWRERYKSRCGREPSAPPISADPKSPKGSNTITTVATLAVAGLALYLGIQIVDMIKD